MVTRVRTCAAVAGLVTVAGMMLGCSGPTAPLVPLSVKAITPTTGSTNGTTQVFINGTGFQSGATVTLDGVAAASTLIGSVIKATTPAHAPGTVDIVVTNPDGQTAKLAAGYTYTVLSVTGIVPNIGTTLGGTGLVITGTGFQSGAVVTLGGLVASSFVDNAGTIYLGAPAHAAGQVDVVVTNLDGQARLTGGFTYAPPQSFDFNGTWDGQVGESTLVMRFTIEDNILVSLSCGTSSPVLSPAPSVTNGEFSFVGSNGVSISGRIMSTAAASGTINIAPCTNEYWSATKR